MTKRTVAGLSVLVVAAITFGADIRGGTETAGIQPRQTAVQPLSDPIVERAPTADDVRASLLQFRNQYLSLTAASGTWMVGLNWDPLNRAQGPFVGFFYVTIGGEKYRYSINAPNQPDLTTNLEVAYDGVSYQVLDKSTGLLSRQRQDAKQNPMAFPNPLFLSLDFFTQDGDGCDSCRLRLVDLTDPQVWDARLQHLTVTSFDLDTQSTVFVVPAPREEGKVFAFVVTMVGTSPNQLPVRIDRVSQEGVTVTSILLDDYQLFAGEGGVILLPGTISYSAFVCPGGAGAGHGPTLDYSHGSTLLSRVGVASSALRFTIDPSQATRVWDADAGTFLKRP